MAVRRKKKGGAWKGFVAGMGLAGIFGLLLLWAAAGPSGVKLREAFKSRMSVMADRADQLVDALGRRQLPGKPGEDPAPAPVREKPQQTPARPERPVLAPAASAPGSEPVPVPAMPASPAAATATTAPSAPDKDITPDDQKQLRELMQRLNQGN